MSRAPVPLPYLGVETVFKDEHAVYVAEGVAWPKVEYLDNVGCVDAIEELGALAQSHGCGLHVDNCLGGFLLSYLMWISSSLVLCSLSVAVVQYVGPSAAGLSLPVMAARISLPSSASPP